MYYCRGNITPSDEVETTQKPFDQLLQGKKDSVRFNKRYIHKNGSHIWADVSVVAHRDSDHKPLFLITTIIDITDRKNAEIAMRKSEELFSKEVQALKDKDRLLEERFQEALKKAKEKKDEPDKRPLKDIDL